MLSRFGVPLAMLTNFEFASAPQARRAGTTSTNP
jgi:hypothetical protein